MDDVQGSNTFRFFGDVFLQDPRHFPDEDEYAILQQYMPMMRALDMDWRHRPSNNWDLDARFDQFVHQESEAWQNLSVVRPPEFLVRPSGLMSVPIALHLLNPTFYVADPYSDETFDTTNPTMYLICQNGFSPENSFIFDQICRRDDSNIFLRVWTDDVCKPHDEFVHDLRQNMSAIVEICWGENAWRKVKDATPTACLIRFPLWGKHKDIRLYLELDNSGKSLKRFVFWVHHPQWFFRAKPSANAASDRIAKAIVQDTVIEFAARLVGFSVTGCFYAAVEQNQRSYPRLTKEQRDVRDSLMDAAIVELRTAFPAQACQQFLHKKQLERYLEIKAVLQNIRTGLDKDLSICPTEEAGENSTRERWEFQQQQMQHLADTWLVVTRSLLYRRDDSAIFPADSLSTGGQCVSQDLEVADSDWDSLSLDLVNWLQCQNRLKIDGAAIDSRVELERAFRPLDVTRGALSLSPLRLHRSMNWQAKLHGHIPRQFFAREGGLF
ncbi:hypothetical protein BJX99DRAFT_260264 [Aspergillus californicus]